MLQYIFFKYCINVYNNQIANIHPNKLLVISSSTFTSPPLLLFFSSCFSPLPQHLDTIREYTSLSIPNYVNYDDSVPARQGCLENNKTQAGPTIHAFSISLTCKL